MSKKENNCEVCKGKSTVKYKGKSITCTYCLGYGTNKLTNSQCDLYAKQLVYRLLNKSIDVGFHLNLTHEDNEERVLNALIQIRDEFNNNSKE